MTQFDDIYAAEAIGGLLSLYGQPLRYLPHTEDPIDAQGILTRQSEYEAGTNHEQIIERATLELTKSAVPVVCVSEDFIELEDETRWLVLAILAEEGEMWTLQIERVVSGPAWGGRRF